MAMIFLLEAALLTNSPGCVQSVSLFQDSGLFQMTLNTFSLVFTIFKKKTLPLNHLWSVQSCWQFLYLALSKTRYLFYLIVCDSFFFFFFVTTKKEERAGKMA